MTIPIVPGPPHQPLPAQDGPPWVAQAGKKVVTFDGFRVVVAGLAGEVVWQAPVDEVGQVVIRRTGLLEIRPFKRTGLRAHLVPYRRSEGPAVQKLAEAVWSVLRQRPASQQPTQPNADDRLMTWVLRLGVWSSAAALIPLIVAALAVVVVCGICGWSLLSH